MVQETEHLAVDANANTRAKFERKREKAFSVLVLNVSTPQLYLITSCKTRKEAWETLKSQFERDTVANKLFLKKKYFRCEMKEGEKINDHLKRLKELTDQLGAIGSKIEEEDQIVTLLGSLPASYATVVTALETKMDDLKLQFVQQALINEEQKRVHTEDSLGSSGASAMSSQVRGNTQNKAKALGEDNFSSWRCYKCGKEGHLKRDCPSTKRKYKTHKAKSMVHEDTEDSFDGAFVVNESSQNDLQHEDWLIDSGASKHMTLNKDVLQNYQQFTEPQSVKLVMEE